MKRSDFPPMTGFHTFAWRGECIDDIEAWAAARNEMMVVIKRTCRIPNLFRAEMIEESEIVHMPESFASNSLLTNGWSEKELGRYCPLPDSR